MGSNTLLRLLEHLARPPWSPPSRGITEDLEGAPILINIRMKLFEVAGEGGYWITPTGRIEPVGHQLHLDWLRHLSPPILYYDEARMEGYIRIGYSKLAKQKEVTVEGLLERTNEDSEKIMKLIKEFNPEIVSVMIFKPNRVKDFLWPGDRGKIVRYLKSGN